MQQYQVLLVTLATVVTGQENHCAVDNIDKWDCAPNEAACEEAGCCWVPANEKGIPWCFYPDNVPNPCVGEDVYNWNAENPGFSDEEYNIMYENYKVNLNIRGTGAIIAAPDAETPGGDYRSVIISYRVNLIMKSFLGFTG